MRVSNLKRLICIPSAKVCLHTADQFITLIAVVISSPVVVLENVCIESVKCGDPRRQRKNDQFLYHIQAWTRLMLPVHDLQRTAVEEWLRIEWSIGSNCQSMIVCVVLSQCVLLPPFFRVVCCGYGLCNKQGEKFSNDNLCVDRKRSPANRHMGC